MSDGGREPAELNADVQLARSVYQATEVKASIDWSSVVAENPSVWVAAGLLQRSRRLLKAVLLLHESDALDTADSIARSILEYAITGRWLLAKPDDHFRIFSGATLAHLEEMEALRPDLFSGLASTFKSAVSTASRTLLPGVKKRMGNLQSMYWAYKLLCETTHPSFVASSFAFDLEDDAEQSIRDQWERTLPTQFVAFSALWTWILATEVDKAFGEEVFADDLQTLGLELLAAITYDRETDSFDIPEELLKFGKPD